MFAIVKLCSAAARRVSVSSGRYYMQYNNRNRFRMILIKRYIIAAGWYYWRGMCHGNRIPAIFQNMTESADGIKLGTWHVFRIISRFRRQITIRLVVHTYNIIYDQSINLQGKYLRNLAIKIIIGGKYSWRTISV